MFWNDAVPNTTKLPVNVNPTNVGESDVCNPKSIVEPATPLVVNTASPWFGLDNTDADITVLPANICVWVTVPPNEVELPAIVIDELAKLEFGIALKPKVNVSVPVFADMVKPWPDDDAKVKFPLAPFANTFFFLFVKPHLIINYH